MASNLIRRIAASAQTSTIKQGSSERGNPIQPKYFLSDVSTSITPSSLSHTDNGIYKVRDMSTNRLVYASRRPDLTGLFDDPYNSEDGITRLVNTGQSRYSTLIKTTVPAPYSFFPTVIFEKDSYLGAFEFSRVPCQKLDDPSDCYDFSQLFQQSIGSFIPGCEKNPNEQNNQCGPLFPADLSKLLMQLKEHFLLQKPIMLLSPNDIKFTLQYIRSDHHEEN